MIITRASPMTGKLNQLDLPVTQAQLDAYYKSGALIQNAFPNLNSAEREFILSGYTAEDWIDAFPPTSSSDVGEMVEQAREEGRDTSKLEALRVDMQAVEGKFTSEQIVRLEEGDVSFIDWGFDVVQRCKDAIK